MRARDLTVLAGILLVATIRVEAFAQSTSATVLGVIADEQRAVVANATVTLTTLDTAAVRTTSLRA